MKKMKKLSIVLPLRNENPEYLTKVLDRIKMGSNLLKRKEMVEILIPFTQPLQLNQIQNFTEQQNQMGVKTKIIELKHANRSKRMNEG